VRIGDPGDRRARWLARALTYGTVVGLLAAAAGNVERWPITSFRLFSAVRTDRVTSLELVVVDRDGHRHPLPTNRAGGPTTAHQLHDLRTLAPAARRRKVRAWLRLAGWDPDAVDRVVLERVERRLDPDGGPARVVGRRAVVVVDPAAR
jgi:hypothetical protein